jgi:hypothetical protein
VKALFKIQPKQGRYNNLNEEGVFIIYLLKMMSSIV